MIRLERFDDFRALAARARRERRVLVVLISQRECAYCHKIKEEVLHPMVKAGDFANEILLGEVLIDAGETVADFSGRRVSAAHFAHRYGVYVTPTLLFLDPDGHQLVKKMVGINTLEMYFYYLSEAVREAVAKLRGRRS